MRATLLVIVFIAITGCQTNRRLSVPSPEILNTDKTEPIAEDGVVTFRNLSNVQYPELSVGLRFSISSGLITISGDSAFSVAMSIGPAASPAVRWKCPEMYFVVSDQHLDYPQGATVVDDIMFVARAMQRFPYIIAKQLDSDKVSGSGGDGGGEIYRLARELSQGKALTFLGRINSNLIAVDVIAGTGSRAELVRLVAMEEAKGSPQLKSNGISASIPTK